MWGLNFGVHACQKNRGTCALSSNHYYTQVINVSVVHWHSGVVLVSNFFLDLHVPRAKETTSLEFFGDGLLLSEV